jgi:hypothetical protein
MRQTNFYLKGLIVQKYGGHKPFLIALANGAGGIEINESRLSRIVHRRVKPTRAEMRAISWRLQESMEQLFDMDGHGEASH